MNCVSRNAFGKGCVYSFGFMPGYQVAARTAPHVPTSQRNNALYPFTHMEHNPLREILLAHAEPDTPIAMKNVECAPFEHGLVVINHRATPVKVDSCGQWHRQQDMTGDVLPAHSAVFIHKEG